MKLYWHFKTSYCPLIKYSRVKYIETMYLKLKPTCIARCPLAIEVNFWKRLTNNLYQITSYYNKIF